MASDLDRAVAAHAELFDVPGHAVIGTALDGRIVYWSEGAAELFGWRRDEIGGKNILMVTPAELSAERAEEIMSALRHGQPWSGDFRMRRRDGSEFVALVNDLPVRDSTGVLIGIVGITRAG